jgi:hypothetical protein
MGQFVGMTGSSPEPTLFRPEEAERFLRYYAAALEMTDHRVVLFSLPDRASGN